MEIDRGSFVWSMNPLLEAFHTASNTDAFKAETLSNYATIALCRYTSPAIISTAAREGIFTRNDDPSCCGGTVDDIKRHWSHLLYHPRPSCTTTCASYGNGSELPDC